MKIEQVLIHYLIKNRQLTLEGIGTFNLEGSISGSSENEKGFIIPENAISFKYDPKAAEDPDLVNFIVESTRKIKPLATSDLESYLMLGRQFLNIGNPFIIPNIGTLHKHSSGEFIFKGGVYAFDKVEAQRAKIEDTGAEEHDPEMFNEYQRGSKSNNGKPILIGIGLLIAGFIAWAIWNYAFEEDDTEKLTTTEAIVPIIDSTVIIDSLNQIAIDSALMARLNPADSFTFKIVVNEYSNQVQANARFNNLKKYGRNVIVYTKDSITYKVAEPFMRPLSDTTAVLDSLNNYYDYKKTKIEL